MKIKNAPIPNIPCKPILASNIIIPIFPRIPVFPKLPIDPKELKPPIFPTPKAINVVGTLNMKNTPSNLNLNNIQSYFNNIK